MNNRMNRGTNTNLNPKSVDSAVTYVQRGDVEELRQILAQTGLNWFPSPKAGFWVVIPNNKPENRLFTTSWAELVKNNPATEYMVDIEEFFALIKDASTND